MAVWVWFSGWMICNTVLLLMYFLCSSIFYLFWEENPPHWLIFMGLKPLICCIVGLSWWHSSCPARQISGQSERTDLSSLCTFQAWQSWLVGLGLSKYQAPQNHPIQWISSLVLFGSLDLFGWFQYLVFRHIHVAYFAKMAVTEFVIVCPKMGHEPKSNQIATHWS